MLGFLFLRLKGKMIIMFQMLPLSSVWAWVSGFRDRLGLGFRVRDQGSVRRSRGGCGELADGLERLSTASPFPWPLL